MGVGREYQVRWREGTDRRSKKFGARASAVEFAEALANSPGLHEVELRQREVGPWTVVDA